MTRIKSFDRSVCRIVSSDLLTALKRAAKDYGLDVSLGRGTYTDANFTFKVQVSVVGKDGTALTREAEELTRYLQYSDLPKDLLNKVIQVDTGEIYRVTGLSLRRSKYPIVAERVRDGRVFKLRMDTVRRALGLKTTF